MSWWQRLWTGSKAPKAPPETRRLHLGVDFGTCWSKLVLRDYQANVPQAFVVRADADGQRSRPFRIPSSVTWLHDRLYFGWRGSELAREHGAVAFHSVKMRAAFPDAPGYSDLPRLPGGLGAADMATLVVTYLLQLGSEAADNYVHALSGARREPRLGMTMGAPMGLAQSAEIRERFVEIARVAFDLFRNGERSLDDGVEVTVARQMLTEARERVALRGPASDDREWIRSEAEAGLLWVFNSPSVPPGLYVCTDVGAGTTDVSVFRIVQQHEAGQWFKGKIAFYSAASSRPGMDAIGRVITERLAEPLDRVRTSEHELIARHGLESLPALRCIPDAMHDVYRDTWGQAYVKEKSQAVWRPFGLFVLGGGSQVACVTDALCRSPWPGQLDDRVPFENDRPTDLYELPVRPRARPTPFPDDGTFLLVAYGLSFLKGDVPVAESPDEVEPFEPPRWVVRIDQDEFYPK